MFDEILPLESEFKCYIRPVIDDDEQGWGLIAANVKFPDRTGIYPRIYQWRKERDQDRRERSEKYARIVKGIKEKQTAKSK